ncbi:hypothetical protein [Parasedimentitalea psychrophila]|uniref:Uncharacterized protein n=1 Tax=Parasedimentitalea psychrophila TaxID=2997337 RepID=A0A9Y2L2K2_9RHOB|nr:hypothetical protein [Parasedimentitalea psychrophila]WIY26397.1 hypothetical protein QPJ95_05645 [Parasedimentitalea psychrophila]
MGQNYQPDFDKLIQGQSTMASDAEIMAEIRKVMIADTVVHPESVRPRKRQPKPTVTATPQSPSPVKTGGRRLALRRLTGYQPRWSHNLLILALAALLYSPMAVVTVVTLLLAALALLFWSVGPGRLATFGRACFGHYHRLLPVQADQVTDWANRVSDRMQALSNRLPAGLTQGLYLPSFSRQPMAELDLVEPFDRLLARRRGERQATAE